MSRFHARFLGEHDRSLWQDTWRRSSRYLGLHWDWLDAATAEIARPVRIGLFSADDTFVAGTCFAERKRLVFTEWHHPSPVPFAGLLFARDGLSESSLREALSALSALVRKHASLVEVIFQPGFEDVRGLLWSGWTALPHYNYVSRLETPGDLELQADNAVRRQARKAREAGCTFHTGSQCLPHLLSLWEETRRRQRLPAYHHPGTFRILVDNWGQGQPGEDGLRVSVHLVSSPQGEPLAGALTGEDPQRHYYLLGASGGAGEGTGAPSLLHLELTRALAEQRCPLLYDWVGANTPHIAQFKKKFRPGLEYYHRARFETRVLGTLRGR